MELAGEDGSGVEVLAAGFEAPYTRPERVGLLPSWLKLPRVFQDVEKSVASDASSGSILQHIQHAPALIVALLSEEQWQHLIRVVNSKNFGAGGVARSLEQCRRNRLRPARCLGVDQVIENVRLAAHQ